MIGKTHGDKKLISPAPKAIANLMIILPLYLPLVVNAITIFLMIFKFIGFIFTLLWSYTFIKSQSFFKKGSGILITLFVSNVSWLIFIGACFYGLKTFSLYYFFCGLIFSIIFVQLGFTRLTLYINTKFPNKNKLVKFKAFIEYTIICLFVYYFFF